LNVTGPSEVGVSSISVGGAELGGNKSGILNIKSAVVNGGAAPFAYVSNGSVLSLDDVDNLGSVGITVGTKGTVRVGERCRGTLTLTETQPAFCNRSAFASANVTLTGTTPVPVPFPDILATDTIELALVTSGGTPGFPYATYIVGGLLAGAAGPYSTGGTLTITDGTNPASITITSGETAAQVATALNSAFTSASTKAIAKAAYGSLYVAATATGITLTASGAAAAQFSFASTNGFLVTSTGASDTSVVGYFIG
jgi:hypothetical protein